MPLADADGIVLNFITNIVIAAPVTEVSSQIAEADVLKALSQIIDPDFGTDIVSCGFVKDLIVDKELGKVSQAIGFDELFICIIDNSSSSNILTLNLRFHFG